VLAVVLQQKSFRQCSDGLGVVFKQMKELEYNRRIRLRDLMIKFMQRQEQLWVALPALSAPTLQKLEDTPIDRETVDAEIGKAIRAEASNIQVQETTVDMRKKMSISGGEVMKLDDAGEGGAGGGGRKKSSAPPVAPAPEELQSPLSSEFLGKCKVIEKRKDGMMGGWRSCLAIITADNFLHLFDLPSVSAASAASAKMCVVIR
jgi:hypothetical protein